MASRDAMKAANDRGKALLAAYPRAVAASYDARWGRVVVTLSSGLGIMLDPARIQGLEHATEPELKKIEITGPGLGLHFPKLDVDLYMPGLLDGHFGSKKWAGAQLGRLGGSAKSKRKASASRANGKLGGRPRKVAAD